MLFLGNIFKVSCYSVFCIALLDKHVHRQELGNDYIRWTKTIFSRRGIVQVKGRESCSSSAYAKMRLPLLVNEAF